MRLRYAGVCRCCGTALPAKARAVYEPSTRTVRCETCPDDAVAAPAPTSLDEAVVDPGTAGASARRAHERRVAGREDRIRAAHPKLGGLILALTDDPQSTKAWAVGAAGEERLAARLEQAANARLLHDRRVPGTRANIDHIAVCPSGVHVIDAKRYRGRPRLRIDGGILRPRVETLVVAGRDRTRLLEGVLKQVDVVTDAVGDPAVPVHGVLCFVDADWPLVGGSFTARGVHVVWPGKLVQMLDGQGPVTAAEVARVHATLARRLAAS
jgi:hypothetical protein